MEARILRRASIVRRTIDMALLGVTILYCAQYCNHKPVVGSGEPALPTSFREAYENPYRTRK